MHPEAPANYLAWPKPCATPGAECIPAAPACYLAGRSTEHVAAELCISPLTVQQHLKAVFDKVGVRSRRELVAQIFARHYKPRLLAGGPLGADGWFAAEPG